jgi:adhesin/invasin
MRLPIAMLAAGLAFTGCGSDGNGPGQEATQLAFTVQPGTSTAGQPLSPPVQVSVLDASGDLVTGAGEAVTLSLAPHSGEATLGGNVTEDAVGGVATFADLTVSTAGTNLTLIATATGLTDVTSASFDVVFAHGVATTLEKVAGAGETATVGTAIDPSPTVKVTDGFGDPVANAAVTFSAGSGGGAVEGAEQTTDAAGLATVGQWTLGTTAGTRPGAGDVQRRSHRRRGYGHGDQPGRWSIGQPRDARGGAALRAGRGRVRQCGRRRDGDVRCRKRRRECE